MVAANKAGLPNFYRTEPEETDERRSTHSSLGLGLSSLAELLSYKSGMIEVKIYRLMPEAKLV